MFSDICREYVLKQGFDRAGSWWSGPEGIDIVAMKDDAMLLAECKYRNELTDADLIDDLLGKSKSVNSKGAERKFALFSKSGFTRVAEMRAAAESVELIQLKDMFR